ncbi:uncharacterized protein I206_100614 [Kwoniella pini CBS 10737]|uniref:Thioredoxin n=1 Tax=Kwoniella pini CBS 10737 TaxID=1296096 RepID=A0A1B9ICN0_9TREE|nr:uncharacterized protein I206_00711 [Kwoniella pini CBS 10737]OCF53408.1 hypothetical protein I206_00711 [Kwoniella pini CBS 10737]
MSKVQLYVYDLSRGLAKQMSLMLTGKQIDGIWHTSVVAWGREVFYGQGILTSSPGATHHGPPLHIIDVGETHIDEETFNEYLSSLGEMYTPSKYHLIEFNCNHFTADVVGFLTGQEIPKWISGLPAEFLSTPFGQAMRPQIDAMFRQTAPSERPIPGPSPVQPGVSPASTSQPTPPSSGTATPALASALLSSVAARAQAQSQGQGSSNGIPTPRSTPPNPETSPLSLVSSVTHFHSILKDHPAVIVNFTNTPTCPPCRTIKPVYETISSNHASTYGLKGARFVEVELSIGEGRQLAQQYGVHATPTFIFFRNGKKVEEMKGASKKELENRVEAFLEDVFPTHIHKKMFLPTIEKLPTNPITASGIPNYPALLGKLEGFLVGKGKDEDLKFLKENIVPVLEEKKSVSDQELRALLEHWIKVTHDILESLKADETFPIIDLWRVAILRPKISSLLALRLRPSSSATNLPDALSTILALASNTLSSNGSNTSKPFLLTVLRLITNLLASNELDNLILSQSGNIEIQEKSIGILVESLLHPDQSIRSAAAGIAVNVGAWRQRNKKEELDDVDWEVELVSALIESVDREADGDVSHRLLAALAMIIYLSPKYELDTKSLLEVLSAKDKLFTKSKTYKKKEIKKLAEEIAGKLC